MNAHHDGPPLAALILTRSWSAPDEYRVVDVDAATDDGDEAALQNAADGAQQLVEQYRRELAARARPQADASFD